MTIVMPRNIHLPLDTWLVFVIRFSISTFISTKRFFTTASLYFLLYRASLISLLNQAGCSELMIYIQMNTN